MAEARLTMKKMCEVISESGLLAREDGGNPTAVEIFNYSPTGDLYQIFGWYEEALKIMARRN